MIVDPRTMELVSAVEEMIEAVPRETEGSVKPELLQSVLEIATDVCRNVGGGGRPARGPAPPGARDRRGEGPHDRLRGHPSVRAVGGPAHRGARALPRDRRRARVRRAPGAAVRPARARRHRRRGQGDPRRERHARAPPDPARAVDQLAVLARPGRRAGCRRARRSSGCCRGSGSRRGSRAGPSTASASSSWSQAGAVPDYTYLWWDVRPHPNLGTVEVRSCDAQTRLEHTIAITALIQAMAKELCEHFEAGCGARHLPRRAAGGEQVAGGALRHARAS